MTRYLLAPAIAAGFLLASATTLEAQAVSPVRFGIAGGAAIPTGDAGDALNSGYTIEGLIAVRAPASPLSFRGELGYTNWGIKGANEGSLRAISGTANLQYTFGTGNSVAMVRPYVIGGLGVYNLDFSEGGEGETDLGVNVGGGLEIPLTGITGFAEVRYHTVFSEGSDLNFLPIKFGIRF